MKKIITAMVVIMLAVVFTVGASAATYTKGDIDMNGKVNAADARLVLRAGASLDQISDNQKLISDMDDNGRITAADARTVLRIAAGIEKSMGEITIGEEPTTDPEPAERKELSGGISMSIEDFIDEFGGMKKVDTADGTTSYTNDYVTVISDPTMIYEGNINSISVTGGNYMLCGVYAGMNAEEAVSLLAGDRWVVRQETSTQIVLTKVGMSMKLAVAGDVVTFVEYYIGTSLVTPDDPDDTTTQPPETTTQPPETTTQPPETTTKPPETTTKPPETTTTPPIDNDAYNSLPEQIKAFMKGEFGFTGYSYNKAKRDPVSMYITSDNIKAGMSMEMSDGNPLSIDIIVQDASSDDATTYIICNDTKKYCKLDAMAMTILGLDPNELQLDFKVIDPNTVTISSEVRKESGVEYTVYCIKTDIESCEIYTVDEDIKRIYNYDSVGNLKSRMDVDKFYTDVPDSVFSLSGYKKELTIMTIFT